MAPIEIQVFKVGCIRLILSMCVLRTEKVRLWVLHLGPEYFLFHSHLLSKLGAVATHFGLAINQPQANISC